MFRLINKYESGYLRRYKIEKYILGIKCSCLYCIRKKSYYHVLGLNSTASLKDIKSAYYKLSLQFHPDKNQGCQVSADKFREITEAYEVLSNVEKKKRYDLNEDFKPQFSRSYSQNEYYYGPRYQSATNRRPFSGKTKDFDYDKHFKEHYEKYDRQRQADHEYFKRRWEAEFYRRYPNREEYYRNRYTNHKNNYQEFSNELSPTRRIFMMIFTLWFCMFMIHAFNEILDPDKSKRKPIYYEVKEEDDKVPENFK